MVVPYPVLYSPSVGVRVEDALTAFDAARICLKAGAIGASRYMLVHGGKGQAPLLIEDREFLSTFCGSSTWERSSSV